DSLRDLYRHIHWRVIRGWCHSRDLVGGHVYPHDHCASKAPARPCAHQQSCLFPRGTPRSIQRYLAAAHTDRWCACRHFHGRFLAHGSRGDRRGTGHGYCSYPSFAHMGRNQACAGRHSGGHLHDLRCGGRGQHVRCFHVAQHFAERTGRVPDECRRRTGGNHSHELRIRHHSWHVHRCRLHPAVDDTHCRAGADRPGCEFRLVRHHHDQAAGNRFGDAPCWLERVCDQEFAGQSCAVERNLPWRSVVHLHGRHHAAAVDRFPFYLACSAPPDGVNQELQSIPTKNEEHP